MESRSRTAIAAGCLPWARRALPVTVSILLAWAPPVHAQDPSQPVAITFEGARARLDRVSPALSGQAHEVRASEEQEAALKALHRPIVSVSASVIEYQKSLSLDLTGEKDQFGNAAGEFLDGLPGQFPPEFAGIVSQVTARVEQALPGLLSVIPDSLDFRTRDTVVRPRVAFGLART